MSCAGHWHSRREKNTKLNGSCDKHRSTNDSLIFVNKKKLTKFPDSILGSPFWTVIFVGKNLWENQLNPSNQNGARLRQEQPKESQFPFLGGFERAGKNLFFGMFDARIPFGKLTYPTWGKGKSSSKCTFQGIC